MRRNVGLPTFGQLANKYWEVITVPSGKKRCTCVDVVFDCYDKKNSIKYGKQVIHCLRRENINSSHASPFTSETRPT